MSLQAGKGTDFCLSCLWPKAGKRCYRGDRCKSCAMRVKQMGHPVSADTRAKIGAAGIGRIWNIESKAKYSASRMGHPVSKETRAKIGAANKGLPRSEEYRAKISASLTGRTHPVSPETGAKISAALMGHVINEETRTKLRTSHIGHYPSRETRIKMGLANAGERHHNWRGGISFESYGLEFNEELKEIIRKRDDRLCQNLECYLPENGKKHPVHHVDFCKTHNNQINLLTLCHSCHAKTITGDRDYWQEYYQSIQEIRGIT